MLTQLNRSSFRTVWLATSGETPLRGTRELTVSQGSNVLAYLESRVLPLGSIDEVTEAWGCLLIR
jgi:hypothetical protein